METLIVPGFACSYLMREASGLIRRDLASRRVLQRKPQIERRVALVTSSLLITLRRNNPDFASRIAVRLGED